MIYKMKSLNMKQKREFNTFGVRTNQGCDFESTGSSWTGNFIPQIEYEFTGDKDKDNISYGLGVYADDGLEGIIQYDSKDETGFLKLTGSKGIYLGYQGTSTFINLPNDFKKSVRSIAPPFVESGIIFGYKPMESGNFTVAMQRQDDSHLAYNIGYAQEKWGLLYSDTISKSQNTNLFMAFFQFSNILAKYGKERFEDSASVISLGYLFPFDLEASLTYYSLEKPKDGTQEESLWVIDLLLNNLFLELHYSENELGYFSATYNQLNIGGVPVQFTYNYSPSGDDTIDLNMYIPF